jgi:ribonuclease-3
LSERDAGAAGELGVVTPEAQRVATTALQTRLGYQFKDPDLLHRALTHRSVSGQDNYERLEFLGDALLGFVIGRELFTRHPQAAESALTLMRAKLVKRSALAAHARALALAPALRLGPGEQKSGGHRRDSILADVVEALLGAVLLDGGAMEAEALVLRLYAPQLEASAPDQVEKDPKTTLQEWLQGRGHPLPRYQVAQVRGEDHAQSFEVACELEAPAGRYLGEGSSRRAAEQAAASKALDVLRSS